MEERAMSPVVEPRAGFEPISPQIALDLDDRR
jgi:hypothetical protein